MSAPRNESLDDFPYPIGTIVMRTDTVIGYGSVGKIVGVKNYSYDIEVIHSTSASMSRDEISFWAHIFCDPATKTADWEV